MCYRMRNFTCCELVNMSKTKIQTSFWISECEKWREIHKINTYTKIKNQNIKGEPTHKTNRWMENQNYIRLLKSNMERWCVLGVNKAVDFTLPRKTMCNQRRLIQMAKSNSRVILNKYTYNIHVYCQYSFRNYTWISFIKNKKLNQERVKHDMESSEVSIMKAVKERWMEGLGEQVLKKIGI